MIEDAQRQHILGRLRQVETDRSVRILFAAESGSRAWGFASPDSDWDVRFIYAHSREWYLRINEGRDVIERPLDERLVDMSGWDLRKAMRLLLKSNSTLYEWFASPIVYRDDGVFAPAAKSLFERHANPKTLAYHYASLVRSSCGRINGTDTVRLKRYFYVVRPLLALLWVTSKGTPPPMKLSDLLSGCEIEVGVRRAIEHLVDLKQATPELGVGPRIETLDRWIAAHLSHLDGSLRQLSDHDQKPTRAEADTLFLRLIDGS